MWNLTSLRAARACRKLGRVATRLCSAPSQPGTRPSMLAEPSLRPVLPAPARSWQNDHTQPLANWGVPSARKIVDTVTRAGATVVGPVPLPTEKNVIAVIRSPHKYKDSREHFEMRTHKRLIDIIDPTPKAVDSLMRLDLPADVNIEIKL